MSRVIKAAIWQEKPCIVEPPPAPVHVQEEPLSAEFTEEAQAAMLATIQEKEQRAEKMLQEAKVSCEILKQEARQQQEQILSEAHDEANQIREEAKQTGYEAGFAAGQEAGMKKVQEEQAQTLRAANEKAEHTLAVARKETSSYVQEAEEEIVNLVLHIVEKILPQHFLDVPQVILPLVRKALLKIKDQNEVIAHVPPESYDLVLMARSEFQTLLEGNARLEVKADESLHAGDCILESPNGNVDARLATQLELVKKSLQDVLS